MEIDKSKASQIYGVPGVTWKVGEVRYNALWQEVEFVSHGEKDGDPEIYRVKASIPKEILVEEPVVIEKQDTFNWNMKKDDIVKALRELNVQFSPMRTRSQLINLLKQNSMRPEMKQV